MHFTSARRLFFPGNPFLKIGNASWADTAAAVCRSSGCDCDVEILEELLPFPCCLRCCVLALGAAFAAAAAAATAAEVGPTAPVAGACVGVTEYSTLLTYYLQTESIELNYAEP